MTALNYQEMFDQACHHFAQQREPSNNGNGQCAYRGLHNRKCAVGIFITDEEYSPKMETIAARNLAKSFPCLRRFKGHETFLMGLQDAHDNCHHLEQLQRWLIRLAVTWRLDPAAIQLIKEWELYGSTRTDYEGSYDAFVKELETEGYGKADHDDDEEDEEDEEPAEEEEEEDTIEEKELAYV